MIGAAINHPDQGKCLDLSLETNKLLGIEDSYVKLYPNNGYGDANLIRTLINIEKPDALMFITDPRSYIWLFQAENEIRKKLPLIYLEIWDSPLPYPIYNATYYESCDMLLAISKQTKNINKVLLEAKGVPFKDLDTVS